MSECRNKKGIGRERSCQEKSPGASGISWPDVIFVCKVLIVLIIAKRSLIYWMIPDTPVFYWMIVSVLVYSWHHIRPAGHKEKGLLFFWTALLSMAVMAAYVVANRFILTIGRLRFLMDMGSLFLSSWILTNAVCCLFDRISSKWGSARLDLTRTGIGSKKRFAAVFVFIFLMWMPYFLTYYPGLIFGDSINSIYQALGIRDWNDHFPVVYSLFVKVCMQAGVLSGDLNIGYAVYTLIQMAVISCVHAYTVCWIEHKGCPALALAGCFYFAFEPMFAQHAVAMWKDGIFSAFLLYFSIFLFDLVISDGRVARSRRFCAWSILSALVVCFFRNNGVYVIALVCLGLGIYSFVDRRYCREKVRYVSYHCMVIAIVLFMTGPVYRMVGIERDEVEKYGILLQQMARTVVEEGDIGEEERAFLDSLLPIERYKELYNAQLVDPIKWNKDFDKALLEREQGRLFNVWARLLIKNPKIYLKAYLDMTSHYWTPNMWRDHMFVWNILNGDIDDAADDPWRASAEVRYKNILQNKWIDTKRLFSIATPVPAVGLLVWFQLYIIMYALIKKKGALILPLLPCAGVLTTLLIATPSAYWPRYMLIVYDMLPLSVGMILFIGKAGLIKAERMRSS